MTATKDFAVIDAHLVCRSGNFLPVRHCPPAEPRKPHKSTERGWVSVHGHDAWVALQNAERQLAEAKFHLLSLSLPEQDGDILASYERIATEFGALLLYTQWPHNRPEGWKEPPSPLEAFRAAKAAAVKPSAT